MHCEIEMTVCNDRIVFFEVDGGADFFAYNLQRCRWSMTDEKEGAGECSIKGKRKQDKLFFRKHIQRFL